MVEHLLETLPGNITLGVAVNGITHPHVVGGNALGDRAGGTASLKKMPDYLLSRPDFGESPVGRAIKIDGQSFAGNSGTGRGLEHGARLA